MSDNNHTRAKEKARIRDLVAANMAAISNAATSNATGPTTTAGPSTATQASTTIQPSTVPQSSTTTQPSPSNKSKTSVKKSLLKTSSESAGKKPLVYNPDIDSETEECINVLPPITIPTVKLKMSKGKAKETTTASSPGPIDDESRTPAQNNTEPRKATLKLNFKGPAKKISTPETQAPVDITSLALQDRPDFTPEVPLQQPAGQRRVHPDYPNLPPEVPVDDEGIREYCIPFRGFFWLR
jgi:hypothetical protein